MARLLRPERPNAEEDCHRRRQPVTLAELPAVPDGASWHDRTIVFAMTDGTKSGIFTVPDRGGPPTQLVSLDASDRASVPTPSPG